MTQDPFSAANLRVGHAERDAVSAILQEAAADGRLGMDELDERLDVALQAKTYADLEPLVADLSVDLPWRSYPRAMAVAMPSQGPPQPGYSHEDPLRLDGGMSSEKRDGAWTVPPFLRISSGAGSVNSLLAGHRGRARDRRRGDRRSRIGRDIVPDGWAANDDRLGKSIGRKTIKVPHTPASGQPLLVLHGASASGRSRCGHHPVGSCASSLALSEADRSSGVEGGSLRSGSGSPRCAPHGRNGCRGGRGATARLFPMPSTASARSGDRGVRLWDRGCPLGGHAGLFPSRGGRCRSPHDDVITAHDSHHGSPVRL